MPKTLEERLNAHPELKEQILTLLALAESDIERADEVEERTVEPVRSIGRLVIQDWAEQQERKQSDSVLDTLGEGPKLERKGKKKLHWGTTYGEITVMEQVFKWEGSTWRPFSESAGVTCRSHSQLLQRRLTDFGSEKSFARAAEQVKEHYGIEVSPSAVRKITETHGQALHGQPKFLQGETALEPKEQIIVETDGTMIPIVTVDSTKHKDQRKTRKTSWKEIRLAFALENGSTQPIFGATTGNPQQTGEQLANCASRVGWGKQTQIHGVGDGASWIANQIECVFGAQGKYLIDFYHLAEYLAGASKSCSCDSDAWYKTQKNRALSNQMEVILEDLAPHIEPESVEDYYAPVRVCDRYIRNRPEQFDYLGALQAKLPIGSGQIESAHGYVIQERLKLTGAWWKIDNVDKMLALRVARANGNWNKYWDSIKYDDKKAHAIN